jgi:hypothetical protein
MLAAALTLLWVWSVSEGAVHSLETTHARCEEHGVVEDLAASTQALAASADVSAERADAGHSSCTHAVAHRVGALALPPPPALPLPSPTWRIASRRPAAPVPGIHAPRGPPLLRLAGKTSPPRA